MNAKRKLVWFVTTCCMLGLVGLAAAGTTTLSAHLDGVADPRAEGRASLEAGDGQVFLSVMVTNVAATDLASVFVEGEFIGQIDIREDGVGLLEVGAHESDMPRLKPGSTIAVYDATQADVQAPLLLGTFRAK